MTDCDEQGDKPDQEPEFSVIHREAITMTWKLIAEHPIPNTVFDVLAKHYDAILDRMVLLRFTGCIHVDGRVVWSAPGSTDGVELTKYGHRPVFWMETPDPPSGFSPGFWSAEALPIHQVKP